jgi:hypothetical protein
MSLFFLVSVFGYRFSDPAIQRTATTPEQSLLLNGFAAQSAM